MAATYAEKRAASGQLANSLTTIYTASSVTALLTQLWLYNTSTTNAEKITIAINDGVDITIATLTLQPLEYGIVELKGMALNASDLIKAFADDATTVNYVLSLVEKTA